MLSFPRGTARPTLVRLGAHLLCESRLLLLFPLTTLPVGRRCTESGARATDRKQGTCGQRRTTTEDGTTATGLRTPISVGGQQGNRSGEFQTGSCVLVSALTTLDPRGLFEQLFRKKMTMTYIPQSRSFDMCHEKIHRPCGEPREDPLRPFPASGNIDHERS